MDLPITVLNWGRGSVWLSPKNRFLVRTRSYEKITEFFCVEGALSATNLGCGIFLASPQLQADLVLPPRAGRAPLSVDSRSLLRERLINYVYVIELHRLGSRARFQLLRCKGSFPIGRCTSWIRAKMTEYIR